MLSEKAVNEAPTPQQTSNFGTLNVTARKLDDGTLSVALEGELDVYSAGDLNNHLREAEQGSSDMVIDLSRLEFIDCAGLHQLVEAGKRARLRGGRLSLIRGPQRVHRVFSLTGLETAFEFKPRVVGG
jgi:anti-sigma B factor antagonist